MKTLVLDNWTGNHYEEQTNKKWRNMGSSPQTTPIDTIEYSLSPRQLKDFNAKGGRFTVIKRGVKHRLLLIV